MINVVSDGPPRRFLSILVPAVRRIAGSILVATSIVAAVPLTVAFFVFIVWLAFGVTGGSLSYPPTSDFQAPFSLSSPIEGLDVSVNDVLLRAGAVTGVSALGGFILIRGNRRMVLFLRRFGDNEATRAVTVATRKVGRSWRMVTCDDAKLLPVGVAPAMAATLRFADRAPKIMSAAWETTVKWCRRVTFAAGIGALGVGAIAASGSESGSGSAIQASLIDSPEPIAVVFRLLMWVFFIGGALFVAWLVVSYLIVPLLGLFSIALAPLFAFVSMVFDAAHGAERMKTLRVRDEQDVESVIPLAKYILRSIFSPKLLVLTVEHAVWRPTVSKLIALTSLTLVDVTVPTASLLWEINELNRRVGSRVVFIAHQDSADRLSDRAALAEPESIEGRMLRLLDDQHVLVYTTDRRGLRRFARALHASLEATI